jgi:hypothetical protein
MTLYIRVCDTKDRAGPVNLDDYRPWINVPDGKHEETACMAAHKWMRDSGRLDNWEGPETYEVAALYFTEKTKRHPSGMPIMVHAYTLLFRKDGAA